MTDTRTALVAEIEADQAAIRDPLALTMFAAWVNVPVDAIPENMKGHTCEATMIAWQRVGRAAEAYHAAYIAELEAALLQIETTEIHATYGSLNDIRSGHVADLEAQLRLIKDVAHRALRKEPQK